MTKSIVVSVLLVAALAACAQNRIEPPTVADNAANPANAGFVSYCGPVWLVEKQGYLRIPCPAGSNYPGGG